MSEINFNSLKTGPDANGKFGIHGGRFVAETLMPLILDVESSYEKAIKDISFINELEKKLGIKAVRNYMSMQKGDVKLTLSDTSLLKKFTGYNPETNYKVGIKKFLEWYLSYNNLKNKN